MMATTANQPKGEGVYKVLTVAGVALFAAANAWATSQRGYWAVGGELFFLLLPLYAWGFAGVARDDS